MPFASLNHFNFQKTSRRDDLISLCYLMIYMFRKGNCPFIVNDDLSKKETFNLIKNIKETTSNAQLIGDIEDSGFLLQFFNNIFELKYAE